MAKTKKLTDKELLQKEVEEFELQKKEFEEEREEFEQEKEEFEKDKAEFEKSVEAAAKKKKSGNVTYKVVHGPISRDLDGVRVKLRKGDTFTCPEIKDPAMLDRLSVVA